MFFDFFNKQCGCDCDCDDCADKQENCCEPTCVECECRPSVRPNRPKDRADAASVRPVRRARPVR